MFTVYINKFRARLVAPTWIEASLSVLQIDTLIHLVQAGIKNTLLLRDLDPPNLCPN